MFTALEINDQGEIGSIRFSTLFFTVSNFCFAYRVWGAEVFEHLAVLDHRNKEK